MIGMSQKLKIKYKKVVRGLFFQHKKAKDCLGPRHHPTHMGSESSKLAKKTGCTITPCLPLWAFAFRSNMQLIHVLVARGLTSRQGRH